MHPLLFQVSEDGRLPYYPFDYSHGTSNSSSFFSGNQPQVNLSLFHNPHQANPKVDSFYISLKSKESTPSCGIDFHPLPQRSDDVDNDLVTSCPTGQLSFDLESFRGKRAQLQNSFDVVLTEPWVNSAPPRSGTKPSCLDGIENELDLESGTVHGHSQYGSKDTKDWSVILHLAFQSIGIVYGDIGTSPLYMYARTFTDGVKHNDDILYRELNRIPNM